MIWNLLIVFCGAGLGGVLRWGAGVIFGGQMAGYWVTMGVNVSGCFVAGVMLAVLPELSVKDQNRELLRLFLMVGILGGYTTFSAFGKETVELMTAGRYGMAAGYVLGTNVLGLGAAAAGFVLGRILAGAK